MGRMYFPQYRRAREGIALSEGTILDHARRAGVTIASECGGKGRCGRCVVRVESGGECLSPRTPLEEEHSLGPDERLACQARVVSLDGQIRVLVKDFGQYTIVSEGGLGTAIELEPFVRRENQRVVDADGRDLGPYEGRLLGLAVDVGTTTLVIEVVDLESGSVVAKAARKNPQIAFGNDVISRIGHAMTHPNGLEELQATLARAINESLEELEAAAGPLRRHVYDVVGVGNCTMRSIFMGQPVDTLGVIPFEPHTLDPVTKQACEVGLDVHPNASAYGPPLIGGHCGADALADVLASGMHEADEVHMLIDIGTNGEVVLGNRDRLMTCSCAAGGAYEGATVRCGSGAVEGAIKNVSILDGRVEFETIGGKPPIGICGSGLIDLLAELLRNGIMTKKAKIANEYFLTPEISIDQQDIYQLITAKAGLRVDQDLLLKYYGVAVDEVELLYLAGGFGSFISPDSAIAIGLLPPVAEKVVRIGNAAIAGARQMLLSLSARRAAERIARSIQHVKPNELEPDFPYLVAEKMYF